MLMMLIPRGSIYTSDKILNLSPTNKIHLKCDVIDSRWFKTP